MKVGSGYNFLNKVPLAHPNDFYISIVLSYLFSTYYSVILVSFLLRYKITKIYKWEANAPRVGPLAKFNY